MSPGTHGEPRESGRYAEGPHDGNAFTMPRHAFARYCGEVELEDILGEEIRLEIEAYFDLGEHTLVFYVMRGQGRHSGVEVAMPPTAVARWRDGLLVHMKGYGQRKRSRTWACPRMSWSGSSRDGLGEREPRALDVRGLELSAANAVRTRTRYRAYAAAYNSR